MKTFAELCDHKPSVALRAMVTGLINYDQKEGFRVDMTTYGDARRGVCFGCAATCTIMELTKTQIPLYQIERANGRASTLGVPIEDLHDFEYVMDEARRGVLSPLFRYLGMKNLYYAEQRWRATRFNLQTEDWKEQIPDVEELIKELEESGL